MHILTSDTQSGQRKNQEGQTKEEVTNITVFLLVYQDNTHKKGRIGQAANVERHTCRHNPCRQCGTDISTHNNWDSLCQR